MKSHLTRLLRPLALAAAVSLLTLTAAGRDETPDRAAELLARHGSVPLGAFGDYVEVGTYAIQVLVKLGRPSSRLADGTWLYEHRRIADSNAEGIVVVRFAAGRVSALSLATPVTVARLQAASDAGTPVRFAQR